MESIPLNQAGSTLPQLLETTAATHQPVLIVGDRSNAVLVSEQDWKAIQETLHLLSVSGMHESIHKGLDTPVEDCDQNLSLQSPDTKQLPEDRYPLRGLPIQIADDFDAPLPEFWEALGE